MQWIVAGPERARITQEFEESISSVTKEDTRQHEQLPGVQVLFKKDVTVMMHRCFKGLSPSYLSDELSTRAIIHDRQT